MEAWWNMMSHLILQNIIQIAFKVFVQPSLKLFHQVWTLMKLKNSESSVLALVAGSWSFFTEYIKQEVIKTDITCQ